MAGLEAAARKARKNVFGNGAPLQSDESVLEMLEQAPNEGSHVEENGEDNAKKITDSDIAMAQNPSKFEEATGSIVNSANFAAAKTETPAAPVKKKPQGITIEKKPQGISIEKPKEPSAEPATTKEEDDAPVRAARIRSEQREVSPGTMSDGRHAMTSGDKGQNYEPSAMSKLKNKFGLGRK